MINRRNFLALIPSLSAIPLLGKDIIQDEEKITIIKPEPIITQPPTIQSVHDEGFDFTKLDLRVFYKGQEIGRAHITSLSIEAPFIDRNAEIKGIREINIEAKAYEFNL
jgi:hypothetical protein